MNTSAGGRPEALALELAGAAIAALPATAEEWRPGGAVPGDVLPVLGRWWTEGEELVFSWRGRLEARLVAATVRDLSVFAPEGDGYRCVEGRERGELLRVVRDGNGEVEKMYFATYPLRREPSTF